MLLGLSLVSSRGLWILTDSEASRIFFEESWSADDAQLSERLGPSLDTLLAKARISREQIAGLFGVTGPGSFTGLRMSSAFLQGLARALSVPLRGVPTYDLYARNLAIPIRHQPARQMDLAAAMNSKMEFLRVEGPTQVELTAPREGDLILGLQDKPVWPEASDLLNGMRARLKSSEGLQIVYGLEPRISGQR
jgi:hypothetical protein